MAIRIITDSTSDLTKELIEKWDITVMPLTINFNGIEYTDGVDLTKKDFFEKLVCSEALPTTSQVSVGVFSQCFEEALQKGEEVIGIFVSSELSGTFQSAEIAKQILGSDSIHLIDSRIVTSALAALVVEAAKMRDQGKDCEEIVSQLEILKQKVKIYAVVDHLKYLQKGGRMPASVATIGTLLKVKPILTGEDGKIAMVDKVRGKKAGLNYILERTLAKPLDLPKGLYIAHANDGVEAIEFASKAVERLGEVEVSYIEMGIAVGTHSGPGCIAITYFEK